MIYNDYDDDLIKYEILEVLSVEERISDYKEEDAEENEKLLKVVCRVETEFGDILDHESYWVKEDWGVARNKGFYMMTDVVLVLD